MSSSKKYRFSRKARGEEKQEDFSFSFPELKENEFQKYLKSLTILPTKSWVCASHSGNCQLFDSSRIQKLEGLELKQYSDEENCKSDCKKQSNLWRQRWSEIFKYLSMIEMYNTMRSNLSTTMMTDQEKRIILMNRLLNEVKKYTKGELNLETFIQGVNNLNDDQAFDTVYLTFAKLFPKLQSQFESEKREGIQMLLDAMKSNSNTNLNWIIWWPLWFPIRHDPIITWYIDRVECEPVNYTHQFSYRLKRYFNLRPSPNEIFQELYKDPNQRDKKQIARNYFTNFYDPIGCASLKEMWETEVLNPSKKMKSNLNFGNNPFQYISPEQIIPKLMGVKNLINFIIQISSLETDYNINIIDNPEEDIVNEIDRIIKDDKQLKLLEILVIDDIISLDFLMRFKPDILEYMPEAQKILQDANDQVSGRDYQFPKLGPRPEFVAEEKELENEGEYGQVEDGDEYQLNSELFDGRIDPAVGLYLESLKQIEL